MDPGSERRGASAEPEWEMLTLRGLAMTDETEERGTAEAFEGACTDLPPVRKK